MKKLFLILFAHLFVVMNTVASKNVTIDGIIYSIAGHATVVGYSPELKGSVNIPQYIETDGKEYIVRFIGGGAFNSNINLTHINIPNSVISIRKTAFYGCTNLISVNIANGVDTIGMSAFQGCSSLTSINIPNSVITIGSYAFRECANLTTIIIGDGARNIYSWSFSYCYNIKDIFCFVETPPSGRGVGTGIDQSDQKAITLHVPAESVNKYKKADEWKHFKIVAITNADPKPARIIEMKADAYVEERYYDLQGHHVADPSKGFYIINGKKVIIK